MAAAFAGDVSNTGKRNFTAEENQARTLVSRVSISQLKRFLLLVQAQGFISLSLTHTDPSGPHTHTILRLVFTKTPSAVCVTLGHNKEGMHCLSFLCYCKLVTILQHDLLFLSTVLHDPDLQKTEFVSSRASRISAQFFQERISIP